MLISTIHHIVILLFNYYAIIHLDFLKNTLTQIKLPITFETIQYNIELCQCITFFTIFFVFYFSKPILIQNRDKERNMLVIMLISFVSKMCITIYQFYYYKNKDNYINQEPEDLGFFYNMIELSYIIRIVIFILSIFLGIPFTIYYSCESRLKKTIEWSKNYKLTFTEEKINDGSEDV